ncbi:MAG: hypothetical protein GY832_26540, partial [Chloroflexi bacterium]|nr:hypothetical protein [Chloroflexota bacterium]
VRVRSQQPSNFAEIAVNYTDSTGHFIDTLWDAWDLANDFQGCFGGNDALSCYMLPFDALFLAAPGVPGVADNVARHADDVGDAVGTRYKFGGRHINDWIPTVDDYLPQLGGRIDRNHNAPRFYSVRNRGGGRVWVSEDKIIPSDFYRLVDKYPGQVIVLSGIDGGLIGDYDPAVWFFTGDKRRFADLGFDHVKVKDVYKLLEQNPDEFKRLINSPDRVICAWCFSERSSEVIDALMNP